MAKSPRVRALETAIDEEGYETDGMFRWGGPKRSLSEQELEKWVNDFNAELQRPAADRISQLRNSLSKVIALHVDGPYSDPEQLRTIYGRMQMHLNLSNGKGVYVLHADVPKRGFVNDAVTAIRELDGLENALSQVPPNIDQIVRCAFTAGILMMRSNMRALFAADVRIATKRRKVSAKGGKATAKWTPEVAELASEIFAEIKRGKVSDTAACRRTSARLQVEHDIAISAKTLKRRLTDSGRDIA